MTLARLLVLVLLVAACGQAPTAAIGDASAAPGTPGASAPAVPTTVVSSAVARASAPSPAPVPATPAPSATPQGIAALLDQINPHRLNGHLAALVAAGSRDARHPGHAKAVAYLNEQLRAIPGLTVEVQATSYQSVPLQNIFAFIDPPGGAPANGWVLISAHYDSISNRSPGWNPATSQAPGADDNGTGTAALLEYARILAENRALLRQRVVLGFFDGEELFFKGSAAYVAGLAKPYPYQAAINLDMVGFNPLADRLDLLWYTNTSAGLRDRAIRANQTFAIGVSPLNAQFAADGNTIMDAAPFGLAGIPSIALCQRYGENDATFPGNDTFHTVNDTVDKVSNPRLWLKAAKLTLAVALELATTR